MCESPHACIQTLCVCVSGEELPRGFWETNPGCLQEQQALRTAEPLLQLQEFLNVTKAQKFESDKYKIN